jgi:hypothetical protein
MWKHASSVTTKRRVASLEDLTTFRKTGADRESVCAASAPLGDHTETRALSTLWEEIEGAATSFQRRFIASRVPQM